MDKGSVRRHAERHAETLMAGDLPSAFSVTLDISGGGRELRIETTWQDVSGRPMIVAVRGTPER